MFLKSESGGGAGVSRSGGGVGGQGGKVDLSPVTSNVPAAVEGGAGKGRKRGVKEGAKRRKRGVKEGALAADSVAEASKASNVGVITAEVGDKGGDEGSGAAAATAEHTHSEHKLHRYEQVEVKVPAEAGGGEEEVGQGEGEEQEGVGCKEGGRIDGKKSASSQEGGVEVTEEEGEG